jgi:hypothetical protein
MNKSRSKFSGSTNEDTSIVSSIQDVLHDGIEEIKYGSLQMTEDLIRRNVVDEELHIDGTHLENKIKVIEGLGPVQHSPLARALSKGNSAKSNAKGKDPLLLAGRAQPNATTWNLRVLSLPGHLISRMAPISCLRYRRTATHV